MLAELGIATGIVVALLGVLLPLAQGWRKGLEKPIAGLQTTMDVRFSMVDQQLALMRADMDRRFGEVDKRIDAVVDQNRDLRDDMRAGFARSDLVAEQMGWRIHEGRSNVGGPPSAKSGAAT